MVVVVTGTVVVVVAGSVVVVVVTGTVVDVVVGAMEVDVVLGPDDGVVRLATGEPPPHPARHTAATARNPIRQPPRPRHCMAQLFHDRPSLTTGEGP